MIFISNVKMVNFYDSKCIEQCEEGKISPFGTCNINIINNCVLYKEDNTCEKCEDNYKLSDDKKECVNCDGLEFGDGKNCYQKINNCNKQNGNICGECNKYYYILSSDKKNC